MMSNEYRLYSPSKLEDAVAALNDGVSIREAERIYAVPRKIVPILSNILCFFLVLFDVFHVLYLGLQKNIVIDKKYRCIYMSCM